MGSKLGLTKTQIFFLVVQTQVGFGMLNLPNKLQETSKNDGWLSIILAGLCIQCILIFYWLLLKRFPNYKYYEITRCVFGKYVGTLCNLATYIYLILTSAFVLIVSAKLIHEILLNRTPYWVIGLLLFTMCIYLSNSGIQVLTRVLTVLSALILFFIILSFLTYKLHMDVNNILPIGRSGLKNIILGVKESFISLYGFEIILFLYPLAAEKKKGFLKNITYTNVFVIGMTVYFTILSMLIFNSNLIAQIKLPVVYLFRPLQFMTTDRIDQLFFSVWAIPMVLSVSVYIFFASRFLKSISKLKSRPIILTGILAFLLFLLSEKSDVMLGYYANIIELLSYLTIFIIPITLLLTSLVFRKKEKEEKI
jgi:spore germination protein (amino acid permease)